MPAQVDLAPLAKVVPRGWKKLDENVMGDFAVSEILKQFLGKEQADAIAPSWAGDRYAIYQRESRMQILLLIHLKLSGEAAATRLFYADHRLLGEKGQSGTAESMAL